MQFDGNMVLEQLQYAGVFEAIQIRKSGFPFRCGAGALVEAWARR